jgi:hypothetical protein
MWRDLSSKVGWRALAESDWDFTEGRRGNGEIISADGADERE